MFLFAVSFLAGVLTVLAPCILPLLPIVVGGSVDGKSKWTPIRIIGGLSASVIVFTLLLRASTVLIHIPQQTSSYVSGGILVGFGIVTLFPAIWEAISGVLNRRSAEAFQKASASTGWKRELLMGAALGPVFSSCSPTYAVILATVLPAGYALGLLYIGAYTLGLALILLLIAMLGRKLTVRLQKAADPKGRTKRVLGILFILVGSAIIFGWDKDIEAAIIDQGYFGVTELEERLLEEATQE